MHAHGKQRSAKSVKLFEHPDFAQAITATQNHLREQGVSLSEQIIEKDYYVTEALRIIAGSSGEKVIFKGGTSLSKGWNLIQRFSEDIDIFLDPAAFDPPLGKNGINRELKNLRDFVAAHSGLTYVEEESRTIGGFGRTDYFAYTPKFAGVGAIAPHVMMEAGTASGREPTEEVILSSYVARFLQETGSSPGAEDESPFPMRLLHFRRTFVEKMFAIHGKIEMYKRERRSLGSYARHYYDLYQLAQQEAVRAMLQTEEYARIKEDYERISLLAFPQSYFRPDAMQFSHSDALFPSGDLRTMIAAEYTLQCRNLCFGAYPSWDEVADCFLDLQSVL
jgi:predicted nucleotidyltransferase component of viral defense system